MLGLCVGLAAYSPAVPLSGAAARSVAPRMAVDPLRTFLQQEAGVSAKFIDRVVDICDAEMIGDTKQLQMAMEAGLLPKVRTIPSLPCAHVSRYRHLPMQSDHLLCACAICRPQLFKPVVAIGIEKALDGAPDVAPAVAAIKTLLTEDAPGTVNVPLDLEVEPYYDISNLPLNTYKAKNPLQGSIASVKRIVGANAPGEVCHVKINSGNTFKYWEGQSLGVVPPGINPKNGKPNAVRLYSIASTRYGDDLDGQTVSLCVRRAVYWCPELKAEDPAKKGVCSNYLCDATPGSAVTLTGPTGKVMLMPESDPGADVIMVATGTGIAPYRGFLRRLFVEDNTPSAAAFHGLAWLFLGVSTTEALLYDDDWQVRAAHRNARRLSRKPHSCPTQSALHGAAIPI